MLIRVWCVFLHSIDEGVRSCINLLFFFFIVLRSVVVAWLIVTNHDFDSYFGCPSKIFATRGEDVAPIAPTHMVGDGTWPSWDDEMAMKIVYEINSMFHSIIALFLSLPFYCSPVRLLGTYFFIECINLLADPFDSRRTYFRQLLLLSFLFFAFIPLQRDTHVNQLRP